MNSFVIGFFNVCVRNIEGSYKIYVYYGGGQVVVVCMWGGGGLYVSVLGVLCMYMEFAFISMVCVSHCVVLVLRIFVVVGCLCDV